MNYTKEDLEHFERVKEFLGENDEGFIDGEYPFYVDDRLMDENNGTVRKNVYRNGIRTSQRMFPVSINDGRGKHMIDLHTIKYFKPSKQYENTFINYVLRMFPDLLTNKQLKFLADMVNGQENKFSRQLRYKYRTGIQRRLKKGFIGVGGDGVPNHIVAQYRSQLDLVNQFLELAEDNGEFELLILQTIDKEFVNEIVYGQLTSEARQEIVDLYLCKIDYLSIQTLNEFYEHILTAKERFNSLGLV